MLQKYVNYVLPFVNFTKEVMVKKKRQPDAHDDGSSTDSTDERGLQTSPTAGSCQHVKKSVDAPKLKKLLKTSGLASDCGQCKKAGATSPATEASESLNDNSCFEYDNTLWLCLKCGTQLCGRSKNQHALQHFKTPHSDSHSLTMNTRTFEIWCYECDNEVSANSRKNLLDCVDFVKKLAAKPQPSDLTALTTTLEKTIVATWETLQPTVNSINNTAIALPPPPPPAPPAPGMAKRVTKTAKGPLELNNDVNNKSEVYGYEQLPRVRGLTNLGNTCFFNAVMQCLAQTPYLLEVLKELSEPGEEFTLPGGVFKYKDQSDMKLPPIKGTLSVWGGLTSALANALEELQSGGGVFTPVKLFDKLCTKCPQFRGGDQHDSHELLRQLLESVRSEDLKRYQRVILQNLGYKDKDINSVSEEMRQKCKIYGNQAADRILRPDQVFRGFLVSTLTCQDCYNVSSRHEYFLDVSLPVSVEKPQPPQRRKSSPDNESGTSSCAKSTSARGTKSTLHIKNKFLLEDGPVHNTRSSGGADGATGNDAMDDSSNSSSAEQSDADVEDNLVDENITEKTVRQPSTSLCDTNGNNQLQSPNKPEKRGDSPENADKDSLEEDENDSGIATSPANNGSNFPSASESNSAVNASLVNVGISVKAQMENLELKEQQNATRKKVKRVRTLSHSDWSTTIAPRYQCEDGECSVQSCLNNFTAIELMTGNNMVGCENCTKRINGDNPKAKTVNTNATKQFLISSPPAVLILHLKRFQLGPRCIFRKLTRAVNFPMILDVAPFCGSKVKNLPNINRKQKKLLYALYGIVEHSGGMYGGHYTAYVKVRPKPAVDDARWKFLPHGSRAELDQDDDVRKKLDEILAREKARELRMKYSNDSDDFSDSSTSSSDRENVPESPDLEGAVGGYEEAFNVQVPLGKWYYVSDSRVQEVQEDDVLRAQAYLLFYERIY
ncbi:ubiquitin carboxyl-terminal hydrolase 45 isoform X2 [Teleopsis dalmanni]|uniref:ubiquitin carboxyl-terminal hydrolase 45 isoform X2 n=1 Tax=Teleopsis dalmanni TaxID=139649 RepID=UPI0018CC9614|nr:ubiquitin carboxyl-terminal hydrolase 45 isoform X2 [Teleopsis dalmanni]